MTTLSHADHVQPGQRVYLAGVWDTEPCEHCASIEGALRATRQDPFRGWICRECDTRRDIEEGFAGPLDRRGCVR